jgi:N4-gp56 family major capsid protein
LREAVIQYAPILSIGAIFLPFLPVFALAPLLPLAMGPVETYGDITPRTAAWATRRLEKRGIPKMMIEHVAESRPIPQNATNVVIFRRYEAFPLNVTPLLEGVTPASTKITKTDISAILTQYGMVWEGSDVIGLTHEDQVLQEVMNALGENAAQVLETVRFNIFAAGTNVIYNNLAAGRASVASKLDRPSIRRAVAALKRQNAEMLTELLGTTPNFNKVSVQASYIAGYHPDLDSSIRDLPGFKDSSDYTQKSPYGNEIGSLEGVRFLWTQIFVPFADAGGTAGGNFRSTTGTSCDVYPILYFARGGAAIVPLKGSGAITPMVWQAKVTESDPMAQRNKASWKALHTAAITNQNWLLRHEVAAPV